MDAARADPLRPNGTWCGRLRRYAQGASAFVVATGFAVLVGWWQSWIPLTRLAPGLPPMVPLTAVMCVLGGLGLASLAAAPIGDRRWLGRACAAAAGTLGLLTLVEYATGVPLGIDLGAPALRETGAILPFPTGRSSPQAALAFTVLGPALVLRDARTHRWRTVAEAAAFTGATVPGVSLLGYVFGVPLLVGVPSLLPYTGMAIHTGLATLALGTGALAARPDIGAASIVARDDLGGVAARRLLLGVVALLPVSAAITFGVGHGWYPAPVASALVVVTAVLGGTAGVLLNARAIGRLQADAEAELRRGEQRFREVFQLAADGIFVADADGRYVDVNDAACRMLDRPREGIVGLSIVDLIRPEEVPRLAASRSRILAGETDSGEWDLRRGDGGWLPVEICAKLLPGPRWIAFVRDITERRAVEQLRQRALDAEEGRRREVERLLDASHAMSEALVRLPASGLDEVLLAIVREAQCLTGSRYGAIGIGTDPERPFDHWVQVGMPDGTVAAVGRKPRPVGTLGIPAVEGKVVRTDDVRSHPSFRGFPPGHPRVDRFLGVPIPFGDRPEGNLFLADKRDGTPYTDDDERVVSALASRAGLAVETARLYQSEAVQRAFLEAVLDQMPDGVVLVGPAGEILRLNRAAWAFARPGWTPTSGALPHEVLTPAGEPIPRDELPSWRASVHGEPVSPAEFAVHAPDGQIVPILASAAPIVTAQGPAGAVVVFQDIRLLKEVERLREEWSAVVAHDLRQPVAAIALTTDLLAGRHGEALPPPVREGLGRIDRAARQMRRMVDDLLDASRIEAHRLALHPADVDVVALVRTAAADAAHANPAREVRVAAEDRAVAWVDAGRLEQVLGNLLSNAEKYGDPAAPIEVRVLARSDEIEIRVSNRGAGIPPAEIPGLFSRFTRTTAARSSSVRGVGLGLYLAKGIVEAHGGRMWVESEVGGTTTFHLTVPTAPPPADPTSSGAEAPGGG